MVERTVDGAKIPVPHIVRAANRKTAAEISVEIRDGGAGELPYAWARRLLPLWMLVPASCGAPPGPAGSPIRWRRKRLTGTTFVSAVGMFGRGTAWALPQAQNYTLGVTVGGIARKPGFVKAGEVERIEPREYLSLTLSFDHDVVEGAPAARFAARLKELIEGAALIRPAPSR